MENVNQISNQIRKTLLEISRHLTKEDLDRLKFLAVDQFGSGELERIEKPLEFLSLVTEHSMSDDDSVRYTIRLLDGIYKPKLAGMLKKCSLTETIVLDEPVLHYVERPVVHSQVREFIHSDQDTKVVTLVGGVGIGKTELMKHVCLELKEEYLIIQVVDASEYSEILQIIFQILRQISHDVQPNQASIIACLKDLENPFVLSLDISRLPHTSANCRCICMLIKQVQSLQNCKFILTSARFTSCKSCRKKLKNTTSIFVNPLSYHESIKALNNQNVTVDSKFREDVVDHCQGFPIHLDEVREHSMPGFLTKPIYNGHTQRIHVDEAFQLYVRDCGEEVMKALACLCFIKDEFPLEFANEILDIDALAVEDICKHLKEENLLLELDGNYQVPWIVQHYMAQMIRDDDTLKGMTKKGKKLFIQLLLKFLYKTNELFMHYPNTPECRLYDELLNRVVPVPVRRGPAVKALGFYKKYKRSFEWILKEGISDKSLGLAELVADCMNECVSFLAKAMERSTVINLYQKLKSCKRIKRNEIRNACTDISIGFLKMYHNSCHFESESISKMLRAALKRLSNCESRHSVLEQLTEHFHLEEVEAHCLSKLGHIIAANFPDSFSEGESMLHDALKIRQQECLNGSGSRLLVASAYYDIAKIHRHIGSYTRAEGYFGIALNIFKEEDREHPFLATTLHGLAGLHQETGDKLQSSKYSLIAKSLSELILGDHLDTARFIRQHAEVVAMTDKEHAKLLYQYAKRIGENRMEKTEFINMLHECANLCGEEEAACLRKEAEKIKRCASVDWSVIKSISNDRRTSTVDPPPKEKTSLLSQTQKWLLVVFILSIILIILYCLYYVFFNREVTVRCYLYSKK